jgi:hypothetical protein
MPYRSHSLQTGTHRIQEWPQTVWRWYLEVSRGREPLLPVSISVPGSSDRRLTHRAVRADRGYRDVHSIPCPHPPPSHPHPAAARAGIRPEPLFPSADGGCGWSAEPGPGRLPGHGRRPPGPGNAAVILADAIRRHRPAGLRRLRPAVCTPGRRTPSIRRLRRSRPVRVPVSSAWS